MLRKSAGLFAIVGITCMFVGVMLGRTVFNSSAIGDSTKSSATSTPIQASGTKNGPNEIVKEIDDVAVSCLYIDRCLARLEAEPPTEQLSDRVASIIMSAERTLPVFWGVDPQTLAPGVREKIDEYPKRIRMWVDRVNEQKSQLALTSVKSLANEHEAWRVANQDKLYQPHIEHDEAVIRQMQTLIVGMSAGPALTDAMGELLAKQNLLNAHNRNQLTDYQKLAIKKSHEFVSFTLSNTISRDSVLLEAFDKAEVAKIDSALLGAPARRMYDTAIGLMEAKLKDRTHAEFLLKLTDTEKWPLSNY